MNFLLTSEVNVALPHDTTKYRTEPPPSSNITGGKLQLNNYATFRKHVERQRTGRTQLGRTTYPNGVRTPALSPAAAINQRHWPRISEEQWQNAELLTDLRQLWGRRYQGLDRYKPITNVAGHTHIQRMRVPRHSHHHKLGAILPGDMQ